MADTAALRREYALAGLHESELDPDPIRQFAKWFDEAVRGGVLEPNAMSLATADATGAPSVRTVLLKGFDEQGFVFYTNYESNKGRDLAENPRAGLCFPWLSLERQVLVTGGVAKVSREETERYFASRPRGSRIGAWASRQSTVLSGREEIERRVEELVREHEGHEEIAAPPWWGGYRITPATIELWQGRPSRLHDRLRYRLDDGRWVIERLSP